MRAKRTIGRVLRAAVGIATLAGAARASAGLGEGAGSVAEDRTALEAEVREPEAHPRYRIERMSSPANEVREFVSPEGVVFAIAWDGVSHPDLSRLLARYAPEDLQAAAKRGAAGRRHRRIRTDGLVVETWGHMRSLHGRAWAPALVPAGVSTDAIR